MNSLYKKIALTCLVSLTANQAIQAIQFSGIGNWIKGNQKKSAALVASLLGALVLASVLKPKFRHVEEREVQREREREIIPDYTYTTFVNDELLYDHDNKIRASFKNVRSISQLSQQQEIYLERRMPESIKEISGRRGNPYLCVIADKQNNLVGSALCESLACRSNKPCLRITRLQGTAPRAEIFRPIIETKQNIMPDYTADDYANLEDEITKADGRKPKKGNYDQSHFYYDRSETHGEELK